MLKNRFFPLPVTAIFLLTACSVKATLAPTTNPTAIPSPTRVQETPTPATTPTAVPSPTKRIPVGTDIKVDLPEGNLERGEDQARLKSCIHCHVDAIATRLESVGDMPKITERGEIRIADSNYNGNATTNEEYILESILVPEIYIVPDTPSGAKMPTNFDELLTKQDLADLLVWLNTFE